MASITAKKRESLKSSQFALPGKGTGKDGKGPGSYPIDTEARARKALQLGEHHASPSEYAEIKRKVKEKYPDIEQGSGELTPLGQLTLSRFQERWGTGDGHQKFEEAIDDGHISRQKMFKEPQLRTRGKFARRAS